MNYSYSVTVPAGTSKDTPIVDKKRVFTGILTGVQIVFPRGCAQTVSAQVREGMFPVAPRNTDESIRGDGEAVSVPLWYEMVGAQGTLTFLAWSPTATYNHVLEVRYTIKSKEEAMIELTREIVEKLTSVEEAINKLISATMSLSTPVWEV